MYVPLERLRWGLVCSPELSWQYDVEYGTLMLKERFLLGSLFCTKRAEHYKVCSPGDSRVLVGGYNARTNGGCPGHSGIM